MRKQKTYKEVIKKRVQHTICDFIFTLYLLHLIIIYQEARDSFSFIDSLIGQRQTQRFRDTIIKCV